MDDDFRYDEGAVMVRGQVVPRDTVNTYDKSEYDRGAVKETRVMRDFYDDFSD